MADENTPVTNIFNTPQPVDASIYPYNHVTQTRSGHVFEVDDTLGNERISETHKSGTYRCVESDGTQSVVVVSDGYTTICGNGFVSITGTCNVHISSNAKITVAGDCNIEVNGNMEQTVKGNYRLKVGGNHMTEVVGDKSENSKGKKDVVAGKGIFTSVTSGGTSTKIVGNVEDKISGDYNSAICGSTSLTSTLGMSLNATMGKASLGGMTAAVDAVTNLTLTSLGPTTMYSTLINANTGHMNIVGGGLQATLDVAALGGTRTLVTHYHLADGAPSSPAPTTPPIG